VLVLFTLYNILMLLLLCFCGFYQFFVIGHDCAHKSFANNKLLEDIVGTLAFLPLIYPYEPWRFKHDRHHAKTNMWVQFRVKLPSSNVIWCEPSYQNAGGSLVDIILNARVHHAYSKISTGNLVLFAFLSQ
jgi:hypothetical protein